MSKKQAENKKEVTVEALQKMLDEQDSKISTLSEETERVKRNSKIMLISCIIMVLVVVGVISAPVIANTVFGKPSWHEVTRFSGTYQEFASNNTDTFHISSDHWRICWYVVSFYNVSADMPYEDVDFRLFLCDASAPQFISIEKSSHGITTVVSLRLADFSGSTAQGIKWFGELNGDKYITGSGDFSLRVLGASLEWEIVVQAYY